MKIQSSLVIGYNLTGQPDTRYHYLDLPMERVHVESIDVSAIFETIGGRWTFMNMIMYFIVGFFLTDRLMV